MSVKLEQNLKAYRKAAGYTQEELSKLCGISRQSLNKHESGRTKPTEENLASYAKALGVSVTELKQKPHPSLYEFQVFTTLSWG